MYDYFQNTLFDYYLSPVGYSILLPVLSLSREWKVPFFPRVRIEDNCIASIEGDRFRDRHL